MWLHTGRGAVVRVRGVGGTIDPTATQCLPAIMGEEAAQAHGAVALATHGCTAQVNAQCIAYRPHSTGSWHAPG